ncbi:grasp-with-spasm system SPASM domain peptide maturase [Chryseobacterium arthrosphaerae]|uniref:grasp-with-spasm system SPASM domain peptide maturase n=1 Tax=Chryseobacterium arthrosphaerae TaxID=651561 RepID=UPI0031D8ABC9
MKYFNIFSNILIAKGATRILISDLQRNSSDLYPLEFFDVIEELKNNSIEDILKDYDEESQQIIHEYINLLLEKEYGFITDGNWDKNFLPLSLKYHEPSQVSNIFIELDSLSVLDTIKHSIDNLGIQHLIIYSAKELLLKEIQEIDYKFQDSTLTGIEIYCPFHSTITSEGINELNNNLSRIYRVVFYNCTKTPVSLTDPLNFDVIFSPESIQISACGKVDLKYFNTNLSKITEALHHNSCLHKKIGIDIEGNIRNCPLMQENFGNIHQISLEEALDKQGLKKYWNLTKDHIESCKDCEFRYVCTDCRAYTERTSYNQEGLDVSKPLKCGYDPYTGIWEDWAKNPLKQKAIQHYKLENISHQISS